MSKKNWVSFDEAVNILTDLSNGNKITDVSQKYNRCRFTIMNLIKREQKLIAEGFYKIKKEKDINATLNFLKEKKAEKEVEVVKFQRPPAIYSNQKSLYGITYE